MELFQEILFSNLFAVVVDLSAILPASGHYNFQILLFLLLSGFVFLFPASLTTQNVQGCLCAPLGAVEAAQNNVFNYFFWYRFIGKIPYCSPFIHPFIKFMASFVSFLQQKKFLWYKKQKDNRQSILFLP